MPSHTLHDCYYAIIRYANNRQKGGKINYAASYAAYGLKLPDAVCKVELTDEMRTQALYVRTNLSGWRGDEARAVRQSIDKILEK